jgi:hypothetical protein
MRQAKIICAADPELDDRHWIKIKNRKHPAMDRVMEAFR